MKGKKITKKREKRFESLKPRKEGYPDLSGSATEKTHFYVYNAKKMLSP